MLAIFLILTFMIYETIKIYVNNKVGTKLMILLIGMKILIFLQIISIIAISFGICF